MKLKNYLRDFFKSMAIGVACIIPGVSGGTIAIIVKLYDRLLYAVNNLFKDFRNSLKVVIPVALGILVAIGIMWYPLDLAFEHLMLAIVALFGGFIMGSLPGIYDNVKEVKPKTIHYIIMVITLVVAVLFGVFSVAYELDVSSLFSQPYEWYLYLILIPVGMIASFALIVPGISGSMLLLVLGFYTEILALIDNVKDGKYIFETIGLLGCMAIGVIIGFFIFAGLMGYLLKNFKTATFYGIIGFVIGSLFSLFYNFEIVEYYNLGITWWEWLLTAILFIGGLSLSYYIVLQQRKYELVISKEEITEGEV